MTADQAARQFIAEKGATVEQLMEIRAKPVKYFVGCPHPTPEEFAAQIESHCYQCEIVARAVWS
ncbi:MAG: hypothetical protein KAI66_25170 [Lentisphaeria bacterium]|nr:hypothetical protein [Lentisphaeria bacterium]